MTSSSAHRFSLVSTSQSSSISVDLLDREALLEQADLLEKDHEDDQQSSKPAMTLEGLKRKWREELTAPLPKPAPISNTSSSLAPPVSVQPHPETAPLSTPSQPQQPPQTPTHPSESQPQTPAVTDSAGKKGKTAGKGAAIKGKGKKDKETAKEKDQPPAEPEPAAAPDVTPMVVSPPPKQPHSSLAAAPAIFPTPLPVMSDTRRLEPLSLPSSSNTTITRELTAAVAYCR